MPSSTAPTPSARGFTIMEAMVVLVVVAIVVQASAFAFSSLRKSQVDTAARPLLATVQIEGRKVAAGNGYTFPSDLLARIADRAPAGTDSDIGYRYTSGPSHAPGTVKNIGSRFVLSVAADPADPTRAAYAVETLSEGGTGHCWAMVDDVDAPGGEATGWGYSETVAYDDCAAAAALGCADVVTGTADEPSELGTLETCAAPDPATP